MATVTALYFDGLSCLSLALVFLALAFSPPLSRVILPPRLPNTSPSLSPASLTAQPQQPRRRKKNPNRSVAHFSLMATFFPSLPPLLPLPSSHQEKKGLSSSTTVVHASQPMSTEQRPFLLLSLRLRLRRSSAKKRPLHPPKHPCFPDTYPNLGIFWRARLGDFLSHASSLHALPANRNKPINTQTV
ncbi:uncharacterized protein J3D65DRAFT_106229 [Phyllosticta citribraziliensis]|uniref:Uncharacterized protein n=1 Tax=Phyllosticta citribraziliensis TaxID=989973 RepID=A0ABR1LB12_9PEZI